MIELLEKMGYDLNNGVYEHSDRKALFVGDYIDRGPKIRETLQIVRSMSSWERQTQKLLDTFSSL